MPWSVPTRCNVRPIHRTVKRLLLLVNVAPGDVYITVPGEIFKRPRGMCGAQRGRQFTGGNMNAILARVVHLSARQPHKYLWAMTMTRPTISRWRVPCPGEAGEGPISKLILQAKLEDARILRAGKAPVCAGSQVFRPFCDEVGMVGQVEELRPELERRFVIDDEAL